MGTESPTVASMKPVRVPGVLAKDINGELLLYEAGGRQIHILNSSAQLVWELCDGEHTREDMERAIRESFSVPEDQDVAGDIQRTLNLLTKMRLLEETFVQHSSHVS